MHAGTSRKRHVSRPLEVGAPDPSTPQFRLMRTAHESFAQMLESRLAGLLQMELKVAAEPAAVVTRGDYKRSLTNPSWGPVTVISDDVPNALARLKAETKGSLLVAGSGTLVASLLADDLVDELRLMVFPTIMGRGRRLFPDGIDRVKFSLVEARVVGPDGVQTQVFRRL